MAVTVTVTLDVAEMDDSGVRDGEDETEIASLTLPMLDRETESVDVFSGENDTADELDGSPVAETEADTTNDEDAEAERTAEAEMQAEAEMESIADDEGVTATVSETLADAETEADISWVLDTTGERDDDGDVLPNGDSLGVVVVQRTVPDDEADGQRDALLSALEESLERMVIVTNELGDSVLAALSLDDTLLEPVSDSMELELLVGSLVCSPDVLTVDDPVCEKPALREFVCDAVAHTDATEDSEDDCDEVSVSRIDRVTLNVGTSTDADT